MESENKDPHQIIFSSTDPSLPVSPPINNNDEPTESPPVILISETSSPPINIIKKNGEPTIKKNEQPTINIMNNKGDEQNSNYFGDYSGGGLSSATVILVYVKIL